MKHSALKRFFALGIAAFAAMVAVCARGVAREVASSADSIREGGASGGDIVYMIGQADGTVEFVHIFTNATESSTFTIPQDSLVAGRDFRILAVGGGGSGGADCGGGGGAGGVLERDDYVLSAGDYTINVGAGGAAVDVNVQKVGKNGDATTIINATTGEEIARAIGGGGGGSSEGIAGLSGASGGGGGGGWSNGGAGGAATDGWGFAGGAGSSSYGGGGGGGASGPGTAAENDGGSIGGTGGPGVESDITGESVLYAFGGGGRGSKAAGMSGDGVDGDGYGEPGSGERYGQPGKPGTGAGGGGGGINAYRVSGAGGSGVVVIRYAIQPIASGDDVAKGEVDGQKYYRFASNGTFENVLGLVKARVLAVGGGGSGANPGAAAESFGGAGGGGAGAMVESTVYFMPGTYNVGVGAGGAAQTNEGEAGNDGQASFISIDDVNKVYARGGGGGGISAETANPGHSGGSGGGGSYTGTANGPGGAALDADYGNAGGDGKVAMGGAGGGGAGGKGGDADTEDKGGYGGEGRASKITGVSLFYAAGGGGGARTGEGGKGGSGIGGNGASGSTRATAGIEGTGSGGGGGSLASRTGAAGGSGVVVIRIEAVRSERLEKPAGGNLGSVVFDGTVKSLYENYDSTFLEVSGDISATAAGSYTFTIAPKEGLFWGDTTDDAAPVEFTWSIKKAALEVTNFTMAGWQNGETPSTPIVEANVALDPTWRRFEYQKYGETTWNEWQEGDALDVGTYTLRLVVYKNDNYKISPTWTALASGGRVCPTLATFEVFDYEDGAGFPDYLGYHTVFTVTSPNLADDETLENFPMLVRLSETATPGIYRTTRSDLSDIRFTLLGDPDTQVPFEIDTWNPDGESLVWVKMAEYKNGAHVVLSWGEIVDESGTPKEIPAASGESVWGEYEGVWHFNENITQDNAAQERSKDSTANGHDAVPLDGTTEAGANCAVMVSTNGVFGSGRVNATGSGSTVTATRLQLDNSKELELGENFTVSGWMKVDGLTGYNGIISRKQNWNTLGGWELSMWLADGTGPRQMAITGQNAASRPLVISDTDLRKRGYVHFVVIYDGSNYTIYADGGKYAGTITVGSAPSDNGNAIVIGGQNGTANPSFWGAFDEFRIRKGGVTSAWAAEECAQATGTCVASGLYVAPDATFLNRWLREPSASATSISVGDTIIVDPGDSTYGIDNIIWHYTDPNGNPVGQDSSSLPAGTYTIEFEVPAADNDGSRSWTGLDVQIVVTIAAPAPRYRLGDAVEVTRKGRIFLANDDANATQPVEGQSYYLDEAGAVDEEATYWVHESEVENNTLYPRLKNATVSTLMSVSPVEELCGSREIWHLDNVRIGNIYTYSEEGGQRLQLDYQNYLPQSRTAKAISSENGPTGAIDESSHLVMRNIADAAIYSPCYTNGIGAIYFDAVNGSINHLVYDTESFRLVVEVCTNTVEGLIPSDENAHYVTDTSIQRYSNLIDEWFPVEMTAMKIINGVAFPASRTNELVLAAETGTRRDCFYRVVVRQEDLGIRCPARFRIRRSGINTEENDPDGEFLLLVDNIEVSPPSARADLSPYGDFDGTKGGEQVTGWSAAFDPAFPSVASEGIYGRMKVDFYTNYLVDASEDVTSMLKSASLYYRWRYLNQEFDPAGGSDWKYASLDPDNGYRTKEPLKIPAREGDIEFWSVAIASAPYYMYCDYTGLGLGFPAYSEALSVATNRCTRTDVHQKTLGRDWFVRLRNADSQFEKFGVTVIDTKGATNTWYATLADEDMWRFYFKTPTNETGTVKFRLEGINRQENGALEWQTNTTYFAIDRLTVNDDPNREGKLTASFYEKDDFAEDDWYPLEIDAVTGYLLFQMENAAKSITIVHADYQNFNEWADAANTGGTYVGSFSEGNMGPATGTSIEKKISKNDFSTWEDMVATNSLWKESFSTGTKVSTNFFVSSTTFNGWTANYSRYVYEKFNSGSDSEHALQMRGEGLGSIQFVANGSRLSRGIDTLSFTTRLANSIGWNDISYSVYDGMTSLSNYTFVAGVKAITNATEKLVGAYSVSLVANYRPMKGCYEIRYVRYNEGNGTLQLWKWARVGGKMQDFYIDEGQWRDIGPNHALISRDMTKWGKLVVSVENKDDGSVRVVGAINANIEGVPNYGGVPDNPNTTQYCVVEFIDDGTVDGTAPLTRGTFGVASANCPARFYHPRYYEEPIGEIVADCTYKTHEGKFKAYSGRPAIFAAFPTKPSINAIREAVFDSNDRLLDYDDWALAAGRMETYRMGRVNGFRATASTQTLGIYLAPAGSTTFDAEPFKKISVSSYGNSSESIPLRVADDCSFCIRSSEDDNPAEVIIDDLEFTQWRGDNWDNLDNDTIPGKDTSGFSRFAYTNFTFTTCWVTNNTVLMSARRTSTNSVCSIVSPLMDGYPYGTGENKFTAGTGLGQITFAFRGAQTNANIIVQALTNDLETTQSDAYRYAWSKEGGWFNVTNFTFETETEGLRSCYLGMRGVHGLVRLVVDPKLVEQVAGSDDETAFGDIYIDWVSMRDEPDISFRDWWGWNVRTIGDNEDLENRMLLGDVSSEDGGLSIAINNSTTENIDEGDASTFKRHLPFVQSPTFGTNLVGGVTLKARKYNYTAEESSKYMELNARPAYITLYGSHDGDENGQWSWLKDYEVTTTTFTNLSFTTTSSESFKAFRFVIRDVSGVEDDELERYDNAPADGRQVWDGGRPVRIILDEMSVTEAIRPRVGFRYVGAFRSDMNGTEPVPDVPSEKEQPLCKEGWGVQCEIYKAQLPEKIDLDSTDNPPEVILHWFEGERPWGFNSWKTNATARSVTLLRAETPENSGDEKKFVFRSSYQPNNRGAESVVQESTAPSTLVQYMLEVRYNQYNDDGEIFEATNFLTQTDWQTPEWYRPIDYNAERTGFSAYTILDTVAPHWAWINEVNIFGRYEDYLNSDEKCQFVEIAVPQDTDLSDWYIQMLSLDGSEVVTNVAARFGYYGLSGTKSGTLQSNADRKAGMSFRVIGSPYSQEASGGVLKYSDGTLDGVWSFDGSASIYDGQTGVINEIYPIAVQLLRPRGILESEIVAVGTNFWAQFPKTELIEQRYPENTAKDLNEIIGTSHFIYIGSDDNVTNGIITNSLSVVTNVGGSYACWTNDTYSCWTNGVGRTPGHINIGQVIEGEPPSAGGMSRRIFSTLMGTHIRQWDDDLQAFTTNDVALFVQRNVSTNILYEVDNWQCLREVSCLASISNSPYTVSAVKENSGPNRWTAAVGTNIESSMTVTAQADLGDELKKYLDPASRYREAISDWLAAGCNIYGEPWEESDELYLAEFRDLNDRYPAGKQQFLTLEQMYWLDIPPTVPNMWLKGGLWKFAVTNRTDVSMYPGEQLHNYLMGITMIITNANDVTESDYTVKDRRGWSPYVLRGVASGTSSWDYAGSNSLDVTEYGYYPIRVWTSASFNICAKKLNDITSLSDSKYWVPLEKFVFNEDSFDKNHRSLVEILDIDTNWEFQQLEGDFVDEETTADEAIETPFFRWYLKDELSTRSPLLLTPTNLIDAVEE